MNDRRLLIKNPDSYFEEDIRSYYDTSLIDTFANEYHAIYICADRIQISLTESDCLGSPLRIGFQFLINFERKSFGIGEIYRIDDDLDGGKLVRIIYLRLIKRETSYPEWNGNIQILKVTICLIHYDTVVYKKILSCFRSQQLKKALDESRMQHGGFQAFRTLINGNRGKNVSSFIYSEDNSVTILENAINNAYQERQTFIFCTPSAERLNEFATFCNKDFEMSKQTIVFPPGMFCSEKWISESLKNITVHYSNYNLSNNWDIKKIEHELLFRGQDAADLMKDVHPRVIMGTPASLILVMQGLQSHYCAFRDRLPKRIIFDQGEQMHDAFALTLLSSFPTIEQIEIFHEKEVVPVKYGKNTGSLASMAKQ